MSSNDSLSDKDKIKIDIKLKEYEQLYILIVGRASAIEKRIFYALTGYGIILTTLFATSNIQNIKQFGWVIATYIPIFFATLVINNFYQIKSFERVR